MIEEGKSFDFRDAYDDLVRVYEHFEGTALEVHDIDIGSEATAILEGETAVAVALAILELEGEPVETAQKASDLSFNEGLIRLSIIHRAIIWFSYVKPHQTAAERRTIKPTSLYRNRKRQLILVGNDLQRNNQSRSFRVDRISGWISAEPDTFDEVQNAT